MGWRYDRDGAKADAMSNPVTSLGVEFDLRSSGRGLVHVANTDSRRTEILEKLDSILLKKRLRRHDTTRLKGRLTFAEGQLFGRTSRAFFNSLTQHLFRGPLDGSLNEECLQDLMAFKSAFSQGKPRCVDVRAKEVLYLFIDAHFEGGQGGFGAVLYDESSNIVCWFGAPLGFRKCEALNVDDKDQIITGLEALAGLSSLRLWKGLIGQRHLLVFVDNEGQDWPFSKDS